MDALTVARAAVAEAGVRDLLLTHLDLMRSSSPEESCHVMDPDSLLDAGAVLLAARVGETVLGVGALKPLSAEHGELKSMHTSAAARGRGVARAILRSLIEEARALNLSRLSLETGSAEMFAPARALYAGHGFEPCPPFEGYSEDPLSVFMTLRL